MTPAALLRTLIQASGRRIDHVAHAAGLNRSYLYQLLSEDGNPSLRRFTALIETLGGHIYVRIGRRQFRVTTRKEQQ